MEFIEYEVIGEYLLSNQYRTDLFCSYRFLYAMWVDKLVNLWPALIDFCNLSALENQWETLSW